MSNPSIIDRLGTCIDLGEGIATVSGRNVGCGQPDWELVDAQIEGLLIQLEEARAGLKEHIENLVRYSELLRKGDQQC